MKNLKKYFFTFLLLELFLSYTPAFAQTAVPLDVMKDLAPTGKLRAAINLGNGVLAQTDAATGKPKGITPDLAMELARATVAGAGELMRASGFPAETLRQNVTSPKGTTDAALQVLMGENGLERLMIKAVDAATRRARELAS